VSVTKKEWEVIIAKEEWKKIKKENTYLAFVAIILMFLGFIYFSNRCLSTLLFFFSGFIVGYTSLSRTLVKEYEETTK